MLFADVKGFSRLTDAEIPSFLEQVMEPIGRTLASFEAEIVYRNTWGDGLYLVFRSVGPAAACALALQETMARIDLPAAHLPADLGLRIGGHVGPVFEAHDPVRSERNVYGVEVTKTARIEPRTPEGEVYVTDPFAALAALDPGYDLSCEYVGHIPTAKDYGTFPMYVLKRRP
jgi:class 3 adenylate cyclase